MAFAATLVHLTAQQQAVLLAFHDAVGWVGLLALAIVPVTLLLKTYAAASRPQEATDYVGEK